MTGTAGTRIPEVPPGEYHCGTSASGWMRGVHPSIPGQRAEVTICFDLEYEDNCFEPRQAIVINCGDYYLYNLPYPSDRSYLRYCGSQA